MKLDDLLKPTGRSPKGIAQQGGSCVLDEAAMTDAARTYFATAMGDLDKRPFWSVAEERTQYRPAAGLWAPQRRAVGVCLAYLAAQHAQRTDESALVKMPTGTGKTGVVATLACAVPAVRRTLVITPRKALVGQMIEDLRYRFWQNFGLVYADGALRARALDEQAPSDAGGNAANHPVVRLLPSDAVELCKRPPDERLVIVSTFNALEQILRPKPPAHRLTGTFPQHAEEIPIDRKSGQALSDAEAANVIAMLKGIDLVIVDEGHYEPAFVWSQCIRMLDRPTVLLSATPYRNDFKYFSVRGNFAFNLSYAEATEQALIREVEFAQSQYVPKEEDGAPAFVRSLQKYYKDVVLRKPWPTGAEPPRVIVRARDYDGLVLLKNALSSALSQKCVLIHDRIARDNSATLEFGSATAAIKSQATKGIVYWLHQWKLLEGVDEKAFATVAIFHPFSNSRAAIQQIGRVLRCIDPERRLQERATVFAADKVLNDLHSRFNRYLKYEEYFDQDPQAALMRESRLPSLLMRYAAPYQYLFGDFRERYNFEDEGELPGLEDFNLPLRAAIYRYIGNESIDDIALRCKEAMGLEERYEVRVLGAKPDEPNFVRLIVYLSWKNSELLNSHSLPIWSLGAMVLVFRYPRIFVYDTDGLVLDLNKIGMEPEPPENLRRLIPAPAGQQSTRVAQASAIGLDLSEAAIRSVTARMRDFSGAFFDLAQSKQVLNSVRAYLHTPKHSRARYVSLDRSSVSDTVSASDRTRNVLGYVEWTAGIAEALDSTDAPSSVFRRFAQSVPAPKTGEAKPINVLFDFFDFLVDVPTSHGWSEERCEQLRNAELCAEVGDDGAFVLVVDGVPLAGTLTYSVTGNLRPKGRYDVESPELDEFVLDPNAKVAEPAHLINLINKEQAFRVIPHAANLVYAKSRFYLDDLDTAAIGRGDEQGTPLERLRASGWMAEVTSEKGSGNAAAWVSGSIFGGLFAEVGLPNFGRTSAHAHRPIASYDTDLSAELAQFHTIVCDDGGKEKCDFILVGDTPPRVVLVHAKVNDSAMSLNSMQIVGRQALASLAWMVRGRREQSRAMWWASPWQTDDYRSVRRRLLRSGSADLDATWNVIQDALLSARYNKEIWIWAGRSLKRSSLVAQLTKTAGPTPQALQMTYFLSSLQTSAARANVDMRIYCSP